ncbi:unnamed protein product [Ophioblennius macclurei]
MEQTINLRRTQSLKSFSDSCDKPIWTDTGLREKTTSVSDLVARYQSPVKGNAVVQETPIDHSKAKKVQQEPPKKTPSPQKAPLKSILKKKNDMKSQDILRKENDVKSPDILKKKNDVKSPDILKKKNDVKTPDKANLSPAKSMDDLPSNTSSIMSLKAMYEAKAATPDKDKSSPRATSSSFRVTKSSPHVKDVPKMNRDVVDAKIAETKDKKKLETVQNVRKTETKQEQVLKTETKQEQVAKKTVKVDRVQRRRTIGGIDFEQIAAFDADEKRKSIADFRDNAFIQAKETVSISVKVMSALYLSKVANQESTSTPPKPKPTSTPPKPEHNQPAEPVKRAKSFKFQATTQEMCSACSKPVYQMEKIAADKYTFHKNCFSCKKCKKKLSVSNYIPVNGEFYCIFHYKQLVRSKGNYDEGFGHAQHKSRWLQRSMSVPNQHEEYDE